LFGALLLADGIYVSIKKRANHVLSGGLILVLMLVVLRALGPLQNPGFWRTLLASAVAVLAAYAAYTLRFVPDKVAARIKLPRPSPELVRIFLGVVLIAFAAFLQIRLALVPGMYLPAHG
jgi:hypothetical protein